MPQPRWIDRKYTYDAENQLTSVTFEDGSTVVYSYDRAGNRISVTRGAAGASGASAPGAVPPSSGPAAADSPPMADRCSTCGADILPGKKFCTSCGSLVSTGPATGAAPLVCPSCGKGIRPGKKFCGYCGRAIP